MHTGTFRRRLLRVAITTTMLSLLLIGGCALPLPADSKTAEYRRVDAQLRAIDDYEALKRACRARGGVVYVGGGPSRLRAKIPDLSTAQCSRPFSVSRL